MILRRSCTEYFFYQFKYSNNSWAAIDSKQIIQVKFNQPPYPNPQHALRFIITSNLTIRSVQLCGQGFKPTTLRRKLSERQVCDDNDKDQEGKPCYYTSEPVCVGDCFDVVPLMRIFSNCDYPLCGRMGLMAFTRDEVLNKLEVISGQQLEKYIQCEMEIMDDALTYDV